MQYASLFSLTIYGGIHFVSTPFFDFWVIWASFVQFSKWIGRALITRLTETFCKETNEWMNEQIAEWMNEWMNWTCLDNQIELDFLQGNKWMNEWKNGRMKEWIGCTLITRLTETFYEKTNEWMNELMIEWMNEWVKELDLLW